MNKKVAPLFFQGYVACAWGVHNIGYVLITYGFVDAVCSASFGSFIKYVKCTFLSFFLFSKLLSII